MTEGKVIGKRYDAAMTFNAPSPDVSEAEARKGRRGSGGRPSHEEALRRDARLVQIAGAMFMERGFDGTTIDAVAEAASVGKATLYARYRDKSELFAAVFRSQIDRWLAVNAVEAPAPGDRVEDVLLAMGRRMIAAGLSPEAIAIKRIVMAQATRFPELAMLVHREGWQRSNAWVAGVLNHFAADGQIAVTDGELAADLFLSLIIGRQTRLAMLGIATDFEDVDRRLKAAVALFVKGMAIED
jgi:TetR/AcrR family transcriptional regulator, mexJK operon transcriptional repressor